MKSVSSHLKVFVAILTYADFCSGIIGGFACSPYPFFVYIQVSSEFCGGALIASATVAIAAHCLFNPFEKRWLDYRNVFVLKGDFIKPNWHQIATLYSCARYLYHNLYNPTFNEGVGPYDIALIILGENIDLSKSENDIIEL